MSSRVSIIGAGNVGATAAQLIVQSGLADIVLYDIVEGVPQGKALDMMEATPLWDASSRCIGTNDLKDTKGSDVIVITAGLARKPGMSRDDLLSANADIMRKVAGAAAPLSPDAVIVVVTNPMDVMAQLVWKVSGFRSQRVVGMGGILDAARFRSFISMELGISPLGIDAVVMGGHGDQMVPLPRFASVQGVPLSEMMAAEALQKLIERTRQGGAEIVSLLKTGSAYYAPAASTFQMVKAILLDEKRVLPCSAYLNGQYGFSDIFTGVPVVLGKDGVEKILELGLNDIERAEFEKSAAATKELVGKILPK